MPIELEDEKYVREALHARFGIAMQKIPRVPNVKTPDYELLHAAKRVGILEVKRLERTPRTPENGWTLDERGFTTRSDNAPSRAAAAVHEAWKQLGQAREPKVLAIVNDEPLMDIGDLEEAVRGFMDYGDAETGIIRNVASSKRAAVVRIRGEADQIDLFVWFDRHARGVRGVEFPHGSPPREFVGSDDPKFRISTDVGHDLARQFFGFPEMPKPTA